MPRYLLLLLALLLLSACSSAPRFASQDLQHHHWVLESARWPGHRQPPQQSPHIEIGEHFTVNGIAGCNRYFGQGHLKGNKLWVTSLGSTAMACPPN